jgi:soluble lytic murein transglycosylase-like protein
MTITTNKSGRWRTGALLTAVLGWKILLLLAVAALALPSWPGASQYDWIEKFCQTIEPVRAALPGIIKVNETAMAEIPADQGFWNLKAAVAKAADRHQVDRHLLMALVKVESGFDPQAVSPVGAKGLCQLMPRTARYLDVSDPFDPYQNLNAGARYLAQLINQFGDLRLALAGYNAGPVKVRQYGGVPPYGETRRFVREVLREYKEYQANGMGV